MQINVRKNQLNHAVFNKILFVLGFFLWVLDLKYMHVVSSTYMRAAFKEKAHVMRLKSRLEEC